jgi:hypothetical protein
MVKKSWLKKQNKNLRFKKKIDGSKKSRGLQITTRFSTVHKRRHYRKALTSCLCVTALIHFDQNDRFIYPTYDTRYRSDSGAQ